MSEQKHIKLLRKTGFADVAAAKAGLEAAFATTGKFQIGEAAIAVANDGQVVLGIQGSATSGSTFYNAASVDALVAELESEIGDLASLGTDVTTSIVAAINSLKASNIAYVSGNTDTIVSGATNVDEAIKAIDTAVAAMKAGEAQYEIEEVTENVPVTVLHRYQLSKTVGSTKTQEGVFIDINKDSSIISIRYISDPADPHYQNLEYTYSDASGVTQTTYIDMSELVLEAEFASGITVTNHVAHGVVDPSSEAFLTVGADGFKLSGVTSAINTAEQNAKDYTDTQIQGLDATKSGSTTHVSVTVTEADGKITAVTVAEDDIASATGLTAETTARKAVTGQNGDTYTANTTANYISGVTSMNAADVALDAAIKINADAIADLEAAKVSVSASTDTESTKYLDVTVNQDNTVYTVEVTGIDDAISDAIAALTATTVGQSGKFIQSISETGGIISATAADLNAAAVAATAIASGATTLAVTGTTVEAQIASIGETMKTLQDGMYDEVEAGSGITVTVKADNKQTVSVKLNESGVTPEILSFDSNGKLTVASTIDCGEWS